MKQKLIEPQGEMDRPTVIVRDFSTRHSIIERTTREKVSKDIEDLNAINQLTQGTFTELSTEHYTLSFQVHTKHLPIQTVFWAITQASINLKGFVLYKLSSLPQWS